MKNGFQTKKSSLMMKCNFNFVKKKLRKNQASTRFEPMPPGY